MSLMRKIFLKTKWLHKYLGLLLIVFLMWMSISGILLNHPELIANVSAPNWLTPKSYKVENWNRSSLINLLYSQHNPDIVYLAGKKGVWKSVDGGRSFSAMNNGFPHSDFYLKTNHILLWGKDQSLLFAATDGGLFVCDLVTDIWRPVPLSGRPEKVVRLLEVEQRLLAFTDSHVYSSPPPFDLKFERVSVVREVKERQVSLIKVFFDLHDGSILGASGRLLYDAIGVVLFFLSFSAFYGWFYRKHIKHQSSSTRKIFKPFIYRLILKYHIRTGIWTAALLIVIGGTGLFMRPPLIAAIADIYIPAKYYPGFLDENPWSEKIQNALYDRNTGQIVIAASDGLWRGNADFSNPFAKVAFNVPLFVMGATVFEQDQDNYLIGSFSGMFRYNPRRDQAVNLFTGVVGKAESSIKPAELMVAGYFKTPQGEEFITTHEQGLLPLADAERSNRFTVPQTLNRNYRLPLWNYMFELHNGRIFKDFIGNFYILIIPIGAFLFLLLVFTGVFDWFYSRVYRQRIIGKKETAPLMEMRKAG